MNMKSEEWDVKGDIQYWYWDVKRLTGIMIVFFMISISYDIIYYYLFNLLLLTQHKVYNLPTQLRIP